MGIGEGYFEGWQRIPGGAAALEVLGTIFLDPKLPIPQPISAQNMRFEGK